MPLANMFRDRNRRLLVSQELCYIVSPKVLCTIWTCNYYRYGSAITMYGTSLFLKVKVFHGIYVQVYTHQKCYFARTHTRSGGWCLIRHPPLMLARLLTSFAEQATQTERNPRSRTLVTRPTWLVAVQRYSILQPSISNIVKRAGLIYQRA